MVRKVLATLLFSMACSSSYADQPIGPQPPPGTQIAIAVAPAKVRAPYDVEVLRENGDTLPTYALKDRYYVQGNLGERYVLRVTNPTAHRVEAVVTVDGLDVVDGEPGDLRKRGYVVPPYGEVRIEGFRTSQTDVATFRFSGVDGSYAGRKGKARNVGVIAVAIFEERAAAPEQQIIVTEGGGTGTGGGGGYRPPYDYRDDVASRPPPRPSAAKSADRGRAERRPAPPSAGAPAGAPAVAPAPPPPPSRDYVGEVDADEAPPVAQRGPAPTHRPGLGTEFGEQRYSAASFTRFVRAGDRPIAIAELRYNDASGLAALGIQVQPQPDEGELMTRETADPFPGDARFARPPR